MGVREREREKERERVKNSNKKGIQKHLFASIELKQYKCR